MGILNTQGKTVVTYEFQLDAIKELIAKDMNVSTDELKVEYVMTDTADDRFERTPNYKVTKIKVTHTPK